MTTIRKYNGPAEYKTPVLLPTLKKTERQNFGVTSVEESNTLLSSPPVGQFPIREEMGRLRSGAHNITTTTPKTMPHEGEGAELSQSNQVQSLDSKLDAVLVAIEQSRSSLENKIDTVAADLSLLHADHRKLVDKVQEAEHTLTQLQPEVKSLDVSVQSLLERVRFLEGRAEDAEGRSRRNNIRVVGVPEGCEGQDATKYMET